MNLSVYKEAVAELAIPKLTAFLKMVEDTVEIEGWSKMKAPEKRDNLLEAFKQSSELRKEFVAFYADETGTDADWSEWETGDLPDAPQEFPEPPAGPETGDDPAQDSGQMVTPDAPTIAPVQSTFVEGAFGQIVSDVAGLDANASADNLKEAEERLEFEHVRIGALLSHIQSSQHYITLGYDNLREFLAAQTGLHYRKASYLISNFNAVKELGIETQELKGVTWSALRHIIPVMNADNYKTWLEAARNSTHVSLISQVEQEKAKQAGALPAPETGEEGTPAPTPSSKVFNLLPDQAVTINAAIEKAKTEGNVDSNGAALDIIAAAYTGTPPSDATIASVLPDTSFDGFKAMFSKMKADGGDEALVPVLEAIGEIWPDVDITVSFPKATAAE